MLSIKNLYDSGACQYLQKKTFYVACKEGNLELVKKSLSICEKDSITFYDEALQWGSCCKSVAIVTYLVNKGYKINDLSVTLAVKNGHLEVIKFLIGNG